MKDLTRAQALRLPGYKKYRVVMRTILAYYRKYDDATTRVIRKFSKNEHSIYDIRHLLELMTNGDFLTRTKMGNQPMMILYHRKHSVPTIDNAMITYKIRRQCKSCGEAVIMTPSQKFCNYCAHQNILESQRKNRILTKELDEKASKTNGKTW